MTLTSDDMFFLGVRQEIASRYNGACPVSVTVTVNETMMSAFNVTLSVPGQTRTVQVTRKQVHMFSDPKVREEVMDEILFAVFVLLDEEDKYAE